MRTSILVGVIVIFAVLIVGSLLLISSDDSLGTDAPAGICEAVASGDISMCSGLPEGVTKMCNEAVYQKDFLLNGNEQALSGMAFTKDRNSAIKGSDMNACKNDIICKVVIEDNPESCTDDPCKDMYHYLSALNNDDESHCKMISYKDGERQCLAALRGDPSLC